MHDLTLKRKKVKRSRENSLIRKQCENYLDELIKQGEKIKYYKSWGNFVERSGQPDLRILMRGQTIYVELKDPKGRLSSIQSKVLSEYMELGITPYVVDNVNDFIKIIDNVMKGG